jgi:chromosome segregation ATPase
MSDKNIDLLNDKISEYLTEIISLKGNISTLEDEKSKLDKDLNREKTAGKRLKAKVAELEKDVGKLQAEIETITKKGQ